MNRSEHHEAADRLLKQERTPLGQTNRSLILAEAQVDAILALSDPAATIPSGPEQSETGAGMADPGPTARWPL